MELRYGWLRGLATLEACCDRRLLLCGSEFLLHAAGLAPGDVG